MNDFILCFIDCLQQSAKKYRSQILINITTSLISEDAKYLTVMVQRQNSIETGKFYLTLISYTKRSYAKLPPLTPSQRIRNFTYSFNL